MGGAGLVFAEMTCVSPGRAHYAGLPWPVERRAGGAMAPHRRASSTARAPAKVGVQLGHAGRKGSTKVAWEGIDQPLEEGNWPLISASALPYLTARPDPARDGRAPTWIV